MGILPPVMSTQIIDTHCHLYLPEFEQDIREVIQRAENVGVTRFYLPAIDSETTAAMLELEQAFPGKCLAMMGLHPCSVKENYTVELKQVEEWLAKRPFAAVGEIGLDYYWDKTFAAEQVKAFHRQTEWALLYNIPIVIHSRESLPDCIDIVKEHQKGNLKGIFHCFSGTAENAKAIIDLGFYLGIGGVLTYKKAGLAEIIKDISLDNIVLETDAPYLTPVPFRGKRNESSYLKFIVEKVAEIKDVPVEEVARATTANAQKVFGR